MQTVLRYDDPLPRRSQRILIAGVSGTGKTTLARRIAPIARAPHTEIDGLYHGPDWVPRAEFLDDVRALVAQDASDAAPRGAVAAPHGRPPSLSTRGRCVAGRPALRCVPAGRARCRRHLRTL